MKSFVILKNGLCALVAAVSIHHAQAEFTLNTVFTDNMVLQRDQPLPEECRGVRNQALSELEYVWELIVKLRVEVDAIERQARI